MAGVSSSSSSPSTIMGAVALEPALVSMTCCKDENCAGAADGGLPESDKADVAAVSPALLLKITRDRRRREKKKSVSDQRKSIFQ